VSDDNGRSWGRAEIDPEGAHPWAWRRWEADWMATPGLHSLSARATDAEGRTQPIDQPWNRGGFANNIVQRVRIFCVEHE
jgi:hypothetical protein